MVERQVIWSFRAITDKLAIYEYWTGRNGSKSYAIKLERLFEQIQTQIKAYPMSGRATTKDGVRVLPISHFNLFYSYDDSTIYVLAVFDTRRDERSSGFE